MTEIVLGPPGCGKTTRLLEIVDEELQRGVEPDRIGFMAFTRRAAGEAVGRAGEKFHLSPKELPYFGTLHSHCFHALQLRSSEVVNSKRLQEFADHAGVKIKGNWSYMDGVFTGYEEGDRILHMDQLSRAHCIPLRTMYDRDDDGLLWPFVERVTRMYADWKRANRWYDYTDMLTLYLQEGSRPNLRDLIIDEAQDLSQLQWRVFQKMMQGCERVVVAGDDDQAIYEWAGADVHHFVSMDGTPSVLGQSWRVPRSVQSMAVRLVETITQRWPKEWRGRDEEGCVERSSHFGGVSLDVDEDTLILARNKFVLDTLVQPELTRRGIIYIGADGKSSVPEDVRNAITWWERLRRGEPITVGQARVVYEQMSMNHITRGFKKLPAMEEHDEVTMAALHANGGLKTDAVWYEALDRISVNMKESVRSALTKGQKLTGTPKIRVSTIHGSKGGQADHIVLLRDMAQRTWHEYHENPESEARVWYVGITRTKEHLTLVDGETAREYPI